MVGGYCLFNERIIECIAENSVVDPNVYKLKGNCKLSTKYVIYFKSLIDSGKVCFVNLRKLSKNAALSSIDIVCIGFPGTILVSNKYTLSLMTAYGDAIVIGSMQLNEDVLEFELSIDF